MKKLTFLSLTFLTVLSLSVLVFYSSCKKDPCKDVTCQNDGTCVDGTCDCATGYEGANCETKTNAKFIGSYSAHDVCTSNTYDYNVSVAASSTVANGVILSNFGGFGSSFSGTGTVEGTTLTIPTQTVSGITFQGSGTINGTSTVISISYSADDGSATDNCTGQWTKQ